MEVAPSIEGLREIQDLMPPWIGREMAQYQDRLEEVGLDVGSRPTYYIGGDPKDSPEGGKVLEEQELDYITNNLKAKYKLEIRDDNRVGLPLQLHRICAIRNRYRQITGLTIRIARLRLGVSAPLAPYFKSGKNILIIGGPGVGKTTLLRDVVAELSRQLKSKLVIVDTSNEIAGEGDIKHHAFGQARRLQVYNPDPLAGETFDKMLAFAYLQAVRNHGPHTIVGDEVGKPEDVDIVASIADQGVRLIVTVHGHSLDSVLNNHKLWPLIGLPDFHQRRLTTKPKFDIAISVVGRGRFEVFDDVAETLSAKLRGEHPKPIVLGQSDPASAIEQYPYSRYAELVSAALEERLPSLILGGVDLAWYVLKWNTLFHQGHPEAVSSLERGLQLWRRNS